MHTRVQSLRLSSEEEEEAGPEAGDRSPVRGWLPGISMVDYPGRCAAVLFTSGCNFRCGFCHNASLLERKRAGVDWPALENLLDGWHAHWARAAVVSGGEPTLHDTLPELIRRLRRRGWAIKLDTNGSRPAMLEQILPLVDYVAVDLKAPRDQYARRTGGDADAVAESLALIRARAREYEIRTTVVPGIHDEAALAAMGEWIRGVRRWVLQPYVPRDSVLDPALRKTPRTPPAHLREFAERFRTCAQEVIARGV